MTKAVDAFASLAQETRLQTVKLLIEYGKTGAPAGTLSERLRTSPNTLSFHLSHLSHAGLVTSRREGRQIIYSANCDAIEGLILYLKQNCCVLEDPTAGAKARCPSPEVGGPRKAKGAKK